MKLFKVAAGVLNQTPLDWSGNFRRIKQCIEAARRENVSILCLPEMCITGYGCEDAFLSPEVHSASLVQLEEVMKLTEGMVVSVGLPISCAGGLFNSVAILADKELVGITAKQHLAGDGIHYEPRWFKAWPAEQMIQLDIGGRTVPMGDLVYNFHGVRIGLEICEDAWVGPRPGSNLAQRGVDLILNPSASHFSFGKHEVRRRFVLEGSRAFQVTYIYSNLLGNESGRAIFDGDAIIASGGKLLATADRFGLEETGLISSVVDVDWTRLVRIQTASFRPQIQDDQIGDEVRFDFQIPEVDWQQWAESSSMQLESKKYADDRQAGSGTDKEPKSALSQNRWTDSMSKEDEFTEAVCLGLFDYARKSHSKGFVISLSGGADSAAVSVLCRLAIRQAVSQLGLERVIEAFHLENESIDTEQDLAKKLITTVYQGTVNSGAVTRNAAEDVANLIGATHYQWEIDRFGGFLFVGRFCCDRARADLGGRRHCPTEHSGEKSSSWCLDVGKHQRGIAVVDEQPK